MITYVISNIKLNQIVTELFITGRKLNISSLYHIILFLSTKKCQTKLYLLLMNISKKRELPQTTFNHSSNIDFEGSMNLYKNQSSKPYFLMLDSTPAPDNPVHFRKTCLERIYKQLMRIRLGIKNTIWYLQRSIRNIIIIM